jgi:hypothetical protein
MGEMNMSKSTADLFAAAATATGPVSSDNLESLDTPSESYEDPRSVTIDESEESREFGDEETETVETEVESPKATPEPIKGAKEKITITDDKGKRQIDVDFGNKDQLKKYVQMAHGARKWQAERDQARQQLTESQKSLEDLKGTWSSLEKAYQEEGVAGVIDLLQGEKGSHKSWVKSQMEREQFLAKASPEQRRLVEQQERLEKLERDEQRRQSDYESRIQKMESEREQSELRSLESQIHPVFDKYRFADKFGDANTETMFDEMLWNSALKRLEPYEEKGINITPELVDREFKAVASALRKRISVQAEKRAAQAVQQKKREATENVQAATKSGYATGGTAKEAAELLKNGDLTGIFKQWGKFRGNFGN